MYQSLCLFFLLLYSIIICKTIILLIILDEYTNVYLASSLWLVKKECQMFYAIMKKKVLLAIFLYKIFSAVRFFPI